MAFAEPVPTVMVPVPRMEAPPFTKTNGPCRISIGALKAAFAAMKKAAKAAGGTLQGVLV
jgi:hypothetical protein